MEDYFLGKTKLHNAEVIENQETMKTNNISMFGQTVVKPHSTGISFSLSTQRTPALGYLPEIFLGSTFGLLFIALAFSRTYAGTSFVNWFFWLGLLLIFLPTAYRLASISVSHQERISLVIILGLSLYLVKVMHSPFMFTFSDELLHFRNAENILQSNYLFGKNPILPVSALYPGLEIVTTAIASLSGLSLFSSGLIVIGLARLIIIISLFLLFEQISHSSRVAGLAVLLYMANSNFLYWSAQFSYESLSLPLGILALFALSKRGVIHDKKSKRGLTFLILILIIVIPVTHHMTSYALIAFLIVLSAISSLTQAITKIRQPNTWGLAFASVGLTLGWLFWVAHPTTNYLYQIFKGAFNSAMHLVTTQETGRVLFTSTTGVVAPLWERLVGISSVLIIILGILSGLIAIWKSNRTNSYMIVLAGVATLYFITLGLRFTGGGWEIANRSSEFLFV